MGGMTRLDTGAYLARIGASAEDPLSVLVDRQVGARERYRVIQVS